MRYFLLILVLAVPMAGQSVPEAPSQNFLARSGAAAAARPHSFFESGNKLRMGLIAGLITADGVTTQHILQVDHGSELNPVVRPLVKKGAAGQVGASLLGYGISVGTAYLFHRSGHHKLERVMLNGTIAIETECVASNLLQIGLGPH